MTDNSIKQQCLVRLPDLPRWVETRDLLNRDDSAIHASEDAASFIVWSPADAFASVLGEPDPGKLIEVAAGCSELLAFPENIDFVRRHVAGFKVERATLFSAPLRWPAPVHPCQELQPSDQHALSHLPAQLREELDDAFEDGWPVIAACEDSLPVAFAYAVATTETLWDLSIDTLASHRHRGFATAAVLVLMERMDGFGKSAVWGAVESNPASYNLARKLSFTEVDELWDLTRGE